MGVVQMITMVQLCDKSIDVHRVGVFCVFFYSVQRYIRLCFYEL